MTVPTVEHLYVRAGVRMVTALLQLVQRKLGCEASLVHHDTLRSVAVKTNIIISTARRHGLERCKETSNTKRLIESGFQTTFHWLDYY